jgi:glycosyltransferase involved in cell wall biosynthesis
MGRPPVAFLAWSPVAGRSQEIAAALGGEARCFYNRRLAKGRLVPLRYALSSVRTLAFLASRRPRAVIVTNPPIFPALLAYACTRLSGAPILLDSHPSSFGRKGDRLSQRMLGVHAWLARRVRSTLVTDDEWVRTVASWGGRAEILHEAPGDWELTPVRPLPERPVVLFAGTFAADEPVTEVFAAARRLPDVEVRITGDVRRCPPELRAAKPENVTLTGFLGPAAYQRAMLESDLVLTLTTEPTSVMRAAYEAVYAGRPLVLSDWPALIELFPYAVHVQNFADAIADGVAAVLRRHEELASVTEKAADLQYDRWQWQLDRLRTLIGLHEPHREPGKAVLE